MGRTLEENTYVKMLHADRGGRWKKGDKARVIGFDETTGKYVLDLNVVGNSNEACSQEGRVYAYRNKAFAPAAAPARAPRKAEKEPQAGRGKNCRCPHGKDGKERADTLERLLKGAVEQGHAYKTELLKLQARYENLMAMFADSQAMLTREAYARDFEDRCRQDALTPALDPLQRRLEGLDGQESDAIVALLRLSHGSPLQRALYKALGLA